MKKEEREKKVKLPQVVQLPKEDMINYYETILKEMSHRVLPEIRNCIIKNLKKLKGGD